MTLPQLKNSTGSDVKPATKNYVLLLKSMITSNILKLYKILLNKIKMFPLASSYQLSSIF